MDVFYWKILQTKVCFFSKKKIGGDTFCRILVVPFRSLNQQNTYKVWKTNYKSSGNRK